MRVLVIYNEPVLPGDHAAADSENEVLYTVEYVQGALREAGLDVSVHAVGRHPSGLLEGLRRADPDVVFNLFEGFADHYETEAHVAGLLEWLHIPFTGNPAQTLYLAKHKPLAKRLLRGAGLPTPDFIEVAELPVPACPFPFPVIAKPGGQDASVGVDQGSVLRDAKSLENRVADLLACYGPPVLVERFIPGRELCLAMLETPELRCLSPTAFEFIGEDEGYWPIVTYNAKWKPESEEYARATFTACPTVEPELRERLDALGMRAFRLLGCRDYARVDFRVSPEGEPSILEVNPNPDLSPDACFALNLEQEEASFDEFLVALVRRAWERRRGEARGA